VPNPVITLDIQPDVPRESNPDLIATPDNQQVGHEEHDLGLNQGSLDIISEAGADHSGAITKNSNIEDGNDIMTDVEPEFEGPSPAGLYYKSILKSGILVPVRLNDLVVRLRSDKERETGGKRDKLDLFDGPSLYTLSKIQETQALNPSAKYRHLWPLRDGSIKGHG
jgi:hypothetical protein